MSDEVDRLYSQIVRLSVAEAADLAKRLRRLWDEGEGDSRVREPRRPIPSSSSSAVRLVRPDDKPE